MKWLILIGIIACIYFVLLFGAVLIVKSLLKNPKEFIKETEEEADDYYLKK